MSQRDCAIGPNGTKGHNIVTMTMVAAEQEQRNLDQYAKQPSNVHGVWNEE